MTSNRITVNAGDAKTITLPWEYESAANTWTPLDVSTGWTFALTLIHTDGTSSTPSAVLTGGNGSVQIAFAVGDTDIATGDWTMELIATETATSKPLTYSPNSPPILAVT